KQFVAMEGGGRSRMWDVGFRMWDVGFWICDFGFAILDLRFWMADIFRMGAGAVRFVPYPAPRVGGWGDLQNETYYSGSKQPFS
ncbi:MAG: hypothetical protein EOP53_20775, partial [Sphingobacteriales bacterium]